MTTIGLVSYPGAQLAAVHGLSDLLTTAARLHRERGGRRSLTPLHLDAADLRPVRLTALVVPPSIATAPPRAHGALAPWIAARHREGALVCSVCAGAFVLAEAGLLAGRPATTHWALREPFAARFPAVALDTDRILVDDGDVITAGGVMAWIDLGLRLIDRYLGPSTTLATSRFFLVDPGPREQRFYATFAPPLAHGDAAILRAQHWLHARFADRVTLPALARRAALGERTFLRRFQRATGHAPSAYLQLLRVGRARELLETTPTGIDQIAHRVGYGDASAFRKIFRRAIGLSPAEYRRRFALGG